MGRDVVTAKKDACAVKRDVKGQCALDTYARKSRANSSTTSLDCVAYVRELEAI